MSELEELPSWAGRSTEEVQLPPKPPEDAEVAAPEETEAPAQPQSDEPSDQTAAIAAPTAAATAATASASASAAGASSPPALATDPAPTAVGPAPATVAPRRRSRLATVLLALLGLAVLGGAAAAGYLVASNRDSEETATTGDAADVDDAGEDVASPTATDDGATDADDASDGEATGTTTDDGTGATDAGADAGTDDATGDAADEDGSQTVTVEVDEDGETADGESGAGDGAEPMNDGNRQAFFRGGVVYLTGAVPSEEIAQLIVERAAAVVGPDNVVNEYTIDPSVTIQPGESAPLFVEDVILFEFNSIEIATPFLPILDLGTLLLRQNPQASVTVVTRTDAVGSEEINLEVSRARAQAVINYWLGQGVNPDQIIADPRGEEGASDDDDAETAARQRRAEFIITGLLD